MKNQVLIFIDTFAAKNVLQVETMNQLGFSAHFMVYRISEHTDAQLTAGNSRQLLSKNPLKQIVQVFKLVKGSRKSLHHMEIYPGSVLSFYYLLLAKIFGIKTICAERGDLTYFLAKKYNILTRLSMRVCYKYADIVWYRELFMKSILEKMNVKKLFFIHNSVRIQNEDVVEAERTIDFLWVNRVLPERRADWFIQVLKKEQYRHTHNVLIGLLPDGPYSKDEKYLTQNQPKNLSLLEFSPKPEEYFQKSRFFIMPAEHIFANNALLEAMSFGVIPLISDQSGSSLIVEHGINGFIFPHSYDGLEKAMAKANALSPETIRKMSQAARQKMITDFSEKKYSDRIKELYLELENSN